ncbi:hypothetical protein SJAG_03078 [Schizosaccharomyces japonicus yFS275]|uniref:Uncharacterized protein n=1 Tax=Schizosaccharomyces japonicus (strain yFS275 / FY16936) TaxID=402676 RepID=B6K395_SCHJY|nr:hypothetical protein SJAG_03078 [Schizosaccharomyces japonicus yFS275]EEB07952.2 hypothetical protein SJAG_03078 [Schizosaccharomyces japonicus yFS275]
MKRNAESAETLFQNTSPPPSNNAFVPGRKRTRFDAHTAPRTQWSSGCFPLQNGSFTNMNAPSFRARKRSRPPSPDTFPETALVADSQQQLQNGSVVSQNSEEEEAFPHKRGRLSTPQQDEACQIIDMNTGEVLESFPSSTVQNSTDSKALVHHPHRNNRVHILPFPTNNRSNNLAHPSFSAASSLTLHPQLYSPGSQCRHLICYPSNSDKVGAPYVIEPDSSKRWGTVHQEPASSVLIEELDDEELDTERNANATPPSVVYEEQQPTDMTIMPTEAHTSPLFTHPLPNAALVAADADDSEMELDA